MNDKTQRLTAGLAEHAEDIALSVGALALSVGIGLGFGFAFGLIAVGILAIAYGIWITERRP